MRILFVTANYNSSVVGGGQRSLQFLAEGLVQRGHEATVVSSGPTELQETIGGVVHRRVRHANLYWPFDGVSRSAAARAAWHVIDAYNPRAARTVGRIVDDVEPDLVHTNVMAGLSPSVWPAVKRRTLPIVHTLRDYYVVCARSELYRDGHVCERICADCRPFTAPARRLSSLVDAVVGNSRAILEHHLRLGAFAGTPTRSVVLNGYRPPPSPPTPATATGGPLRVGYLGRLDDPKGTRWLLEAMAPLLGNVASMDLAGTGAQEYEAALRNEYESDHVRFLGFTAPGELFSRIDVLVVPSLWPEPLPRTAFEAYGHGVPVLGSNRGGIPEVIDEGETGFVFDPDDVDTFRMLVTRLTKDRSLLERLRRGARDKAGSFLPERVVDGYLDVYARVLKRSTNRAAEVKR